MKEMARFRSTDVIDRAIPGRIKRQEAREGEALVLSYVFESPAQDEPGLRAGEGPGGPANFIEHPHLRWYVSYLDFEEDAESPSGVRVNVRYQMDHPDGIMAAEEFGELKVQLMDSMDSIEPPDDLAGKRAFYESKMEMLEGIVQERTMRQLKAEAVDLKMGRAPYPTPESILGQILTEIGVLPGEPPSLPEE